MLYNCLYTGNDINNVVENTVTNSGNAGIKANLSSNINVENNDIDITGAAGIYIHTVDNAEVIGNDIQNSRVMEFRYIKPILRILKIILLQPVHYME